VASELLDEDNKYYAEVVDKKVDAIKGLKFGKLPQVSLNIRAPCCCDSLSSELHRAKCRDKSILIQLSDVNAYFNMMT
jgi:hypothetical protein